MENAVPRSHTISRRERAAVIASIWLVAGLRCLGQGIDRQTVEECFPRAGKSPSVVLGNTTREQVNNL